VSLRRAAPLAALAIVLCMGIVGCGGPPKAQPTKVIQRGPAPSYADVAAVYNARVGPLDRLWSRTVIRVWYHDEQGKERQDQLEGHLQYLRPDRLLLTFDKVGNTYAALGCNEQQYWWIERKQEGGGTAYVGDTAKATPDQIKELGLPVHPLNFIELLGITPLPVPAPPGEVRVEWSADGQYLMVTAPGRLGRRRLWLDPDRMLPARVELLGTGGEVAISATADTSRYQPVAVRTPRPGWMPAVPGELEAIQKSDGLRVRMTLFDPETAGSKPKADVFDFERLRKALNVQQVVPLDKPPQAPAPAAALEPVGNTAKR
jgi:hypothetical protein